MQFWLQFYLKVIDTEKYKSFFFNDDVIRNISIAFSKDMADTGTSVAQVIWASQLGTKKAQKGCGVGERD